MTQRSDHFINIVKQSRVLSTEQKSLLLDGPALSEGYQKQMLTFLQEFDKNSKAREAYLRDKIETLYTEFVSQLDDEGIVESTKKELLEKAKKQMASFFPDAR